jgi:hypothetical protein
VPVAGQGHGRGPLRARGIDHLLVWETATTTVGDGWYGILGTRRVLEQATWVWVRVRGVWVIMEVRIAAAADCGDAR